MSESLFAQVLSVLSAHLSPLNARSILQKAMARARLPPDFTGRENLSLLVKALEPGTRLFLGDEAEAVLESLRGLGGPQELRPAVHVDVVVEADISLARRVAQAECVAAAASGFATQRVVTLVSELARNIVSYTRGGSIDVIPRARSIAVIALDGGPGISNLESILNGTYKSKTGLGKGIAGVKKLSTTFNIHTAADGTRIEAEVAL